MTADDRRRNAAQRSAYTREINRLRRIAVIADATLAAWLAGERERTRDRLLQELGEADGAAAFKYRDGEMHFRSEWAHEIAERYTRERDILRAAYQGAAA